MTSETTHTPHRLPSLRGAYPGTKYRLYTYGYLPFDAFPDDMTRPCYAAVDWRLTADHVIDALGDTGQANGTPFASRRDAARAAYDSGLIGYQVYEVDAARFGLQTAEELPVTRTLPRSLPPLQGFCSDYRIYTVTQLPFDAVPPHSDGGPSTVVLSGWGCSTSHPASHEPYDARCELHIYSADDVRQRHELYGTRYDTQADADRAAYNAGVLGLMVYEHQAHKWGLPTEESIRAAGMAVYTALNVQPCHTDHRTPSGCTDGTRPCMRQRTLVLARFLDALGVTFDDLPRVLHGETCRRCHPLTETVQRALDASS